MSTTIQPEAPYLMGGTAAETDRLIRQGGFLNPITRRLLTEAGLTAGMRVLDLGSGAGDVALLAAELVGPTGSVIGVDRNAEVLAVARDRVSAAGLTTVTFVADDLRTFEPDEPVDAIIGRLVLMYLPEPAGVLRRLAGWLHPGGVIAIQEYNFSVASLQWYPAMPTWRRFWDWFQTTAARTGMELLMGYRLAPAFQAAGLPAPHLHLESPLIAGDDPAGYTWAADSLRSVLPLTFKFGLATPEEVEIETLAARLRAETTAHGGVVKSPDLVSAWARLPALGPMTDGFPA
jgi:ubiquinone/menaquinone biosynthesis C-methylase UbiE